MAKLRAKCTYAYGIVQGAVFANTHIYEIFEATEELLIHYIKCLKKLGNLLNRRRQNEKAN